MSDPVRPRPDPIAALVECWKKEASAEHERLRQFCYGGELDGDMLDEDIERAAERANERRMCADELEAALRADVRSLTCPATFQTHRCTLPVGHLYAHHTKDGQSGDVSWADTQPMSQRESYQRGYAQGCKDTVRNLPESTDADARPPQDSLAEAIMKVRERGTGRTYFAKRYDTDDEHVLMIYGFGDTFDLRVPKAAVPRRAEPPPQAQEHAEPWTQESAPCVQEKSLAHDLASCPPDVNPASVDGQ
jgi:hypothetical protein